MNISFIFYKLITYLLYVGFLNSQLISTNSSKSSNLQNSYNHTKSSLNSLFSSNQSSLNDDKNLRLERAIIPLPMFKWPRTIHYAVRPPVPAALVDRVLQNLSKKSCLKFIKVRRLRGPGIVYYRGDGCYSVLGKLPTGQPQPISLTPKCWVYGIVEHETLHALGLDHEMSRRDRGKYITLHLGNAFDGFGEIVGYQPSFLTYNLKYDYGSVMHYNRVSSSVNGRITISTKNVHYLKTIGQTHAASFNDIKLLNLHYCNDICKRKLNCSNHGYTDPKNCNVCRCPTFFTGKLCRQLVKSQAGCPNQELKAIAQPKTLAIRGKKSCIIRITAPLRSRIRLRINISRFTLFKVCEPFKGLEVKFLNDKSVAGARFCGLDRNKIILSEGNTVILHYRGMRPIDKVNIVYQTAN